MTEVQIKELLKRYREGNCTDEERESLELWFEVSTDKTAWSWESSSRKNETKAKIFQSIQQTIREEKPVSRRIWPYVSAAASVLIVLFAGWYYYLSTRPDAVQKAYRQVAVAPGSSQAMLTLSDGSAVLVGDAAQGVLANDGSVRILKKGDGTLGYEAEGLTAAAPAGRNTLSVPRGATFQVTMPDGTKAWINSATTISYPAGKGGTERVVELAGEAYFEVFSDKTRPFRVRANGTEVTVTGTHFNVSAYGDDEHVLTTLAEGSVLVDHGGIQKKLVPGQQAVSGGSAMLMVSTVDVESALAWKDGYFVFEDQDLRSVMKMVSRWYDVEVEYQSSIPVKRFGGTFSKSKGLDGLLMYLEQLGNIHYKQQGKKIIIMQ